ncbi:MAG: Crp/Fnr family transcriptional regulator [Vitreoscilla sp.]|nr:Crp/Fnr family transcriptional regulator [Burkholderiales bacterium]MBP6337204.1 Crp/Fnr family transcriptional regulator [Vitreoscilla sp.]MBP6675409.1 Crp/Fnr family transcriptional regulator [Vitreoscilla sp.]
MPSSTQVNRPTTTAAKHVLQALLEGAAGGPLPHWDQVASAIRERRFRPGETVFMQDVAHPCVYGVRLGLLKLGYLGADGNEWIKSFVHEGGFFASIAALQPQGKTTFQATTLEPTVVEQVDYRLMAELAQAHLAWSRALHQLTLAFAARKEQRERELLTLTPEPRYLAFRAAHPDLERRIAQKDLARHLGLTPVGLNRIVVRLRRAAGLE